MAGSHKAAQKADADLKMSSHSIISQEKVLKESRLVDSEQPINQRGQNTHDRSQSRVRVKETAEATRKQHQSHLRDDSSLDEVDPRWMSDLERERQQKYKEEEYLHRSRCELRRHGSRTRSMKGKLSPHRRRSDQFAKSKRRRKPEGSDERIHQQSRRGEAAECTDDSCPCGAAPSVSNYNCEGEVEEPEELPPKAEEPVCDTTSCRGMCSAYTRSYPYSEHILREHKKKQDKGSGRNSTKRKKFKYLHNCVNAACQHREQLRRSGVAAPLYDLDPRSPHATDTFYSGQGSTSTMQVPSSRSGGNSKAPRTYKDTTDDESAREIPRGKETSGQLSVNRETDDDHDCECECGNSSALGIIGREGDVRKKLLRDMPTCHFDEHVSAAYCQCGCDLHCNCGCQRAVNRGKPRGHGYWKFYLESYRWYKDFRQQQTLRRKSKYALREGDEEQVAQYEQEMEIKRVQKAQERQAKRQKENRNDQVDYEPDGRPKKGSSYGPIDLHRRTHITDNEVQQYAELRCGKYTKEECINPRRTSPTRYSTDCGGFCDIPSDYCKPKTKSKR